MSSDLPERSLALAEGLKRVAPAHKWRRVVKECRKLAQHVFGIDIYRMLSPLAGDVGIVAIGVIIMRLSEQYSDGEFKDCLAKALATAERVAARAKP
jgi:hypothetical protein